MPSYDEWQWDDYTDFDPPELPPQPDYWAAFWPFAMLIFGIAAIALLLL